MRDARETLQQPENITAMAVGNTTECSELDTERKAMFGVLIAIYAAIFVGGVCGTFLMSCSLYKTNRRSVNTTMSTNLMVVHSIFLLTVPFRIIYYIKGKWIFGQVFCKIVSFMMHIHMYLSFIFYVIILVSRCLIFFKQKDKIEFYRTLHAFAASAAVWMLVVIIFIPVFVKEYGKSGNYTNDSCFNFQSELHTTYVVAVNYLVVAVVLTVLCVLLCVQILIVNRVVKRLQGQTGAHQEFWAQVKSLFFILAIIISFSPYHLFRPYYITHISDCRHFFYNEICLSLTAMSCFDVVFITMLNYCWKHHITCATMKKKLVCC